MTNWMEWEHNYELLAGKLPKMTNQQMVEQLSKEDAVFRVRCCLTCMFWKPYKDSRWTCCGGEKPEMEKECRAEHEKWLADNAGWAEERTRQGITLEDMLK